MDLNDLLFDHQLSMMACAGQMTNRDEVGCRVDHYARLIGHRRSGLVPQAGGSLASKAS